MKTTSRGFAIYDEFADLYGAKVRVQQSSLATEDAIWVFVDGEDGTRGAAHLNREGVKRLRKALKEALR